MNNELPTGRPKMFDNAKFLTHCQRCGGSTSKKYARGHDGLCKTCADPSTAAPTRNERIIDSGYQAYALEEGHYDQGDY